MHSPVKCTVQRDAKLGQPTHMARRVPGRLQIAKQINHVLMLVGELSDWDYRIFTIF